MFSICHLLVGLRHEPSHATFIGCLGKEPHVETWNIHDVVPEESESSNKSEEVKALPPAGEDSSLVAAVLHETPGIAKG